MRVEERCRQMRNVLPESTTEARHAHRQRALRAWRDASAETSSVREPRGRYRVVSMAC